MNATGCGSLALGGGVGGVTERCDGVRFRQRRGGEERDNLTPLGGVARQRRIDLGTARRVAAFRTLPRSQRPFEARERGPHRREFVDQSFVLAADSVRHHDELDGHEKDTSFEQQVVADAFDDQRGDEQDEGQQNDDERRHIEPLSSTICSALHEFHYRPERPHDSEIRNPQIWPRKRTRVHFREQPNVRVGRETGVNFESGVPRHGSRIALAGAVLVDTTWMIQSDKEPAAWAHATVTL